MTPLIHGDPTGYRERLLLTAEFPADTATSCYNCDATTSRLYWSAVNDSTLSARSVTEQLCLKCGLCCDGTIFAGVELQPGDDAKLLRALGLPIPSSRKFGQPCNALAGCRCQIYEARPKHCRQFECLLFNNVISRQTKPAAALRVIQRAKIRADKIRALLCELGDTNEHLALRARYRRVVSVINKTPPVSVDADAFGKLTLAVQALNLLLNESFYPGTLSD
jgi:Fe-S-cluster containining protein